MKKFNYVKHDTAENWSRAVNFIPSEGELIIYDGVLNNGMYSVEPRFKLGDGTTKINDLPFLSFGGKGYKVKDDGTLVFSEDK